MPTQLLFFVEKLVSPKRSARRAAKHFIVDRRSLHFQNNLLKILENIFLFCVILVKTLKSPQTTENYFNTNNRIVKTIH